MKEVKNKTLKKLMRRGSYKRGNVKKQKNLSSSGGDLGMEPGGRILFIHLKIS
jgi:hypothetical protein